MTLWSKFVCGARVVTSIDKAGYFTTFLLNWSTRVRYRYSEELERGFMTGCCGIYWDVIYKDYVSPCDTFFKQMWGFPSLACLIQGSVNYTMSLMTMFYMLNILLMSHWVAAVTLS